MIPNLALQTAATSGAKSNFAGQTFTFGTDWNVSTGAAKFQGQPQGAAAVQATAIPWGLILIVAGIAWIAKR